MRKSGQELVFLFSEASLPIPGWPSHCPTRLPPLVVLLPQHGETAIMCQLLDKHMTYILPEVKHQSQHHDLLCQLWDMLSYNSHGALSAARLARSGSAPLEATRILCMDGIERIFEKTAICPTPKLELLVFSYIFRLASSGCSPFLAQQQEQKRQKPSPVDCSQLQNSHFGQGPA